jgi:hypothetical protein
MFSGTVEPECLERRQMILLGTVGAMSDANTNVAMPATRLASADDAPDPEATNAVARATIHPAVTGTATAGRELFVTATQPSVGASGAVDWANSIAVN